MGQAQEEGGEEEAQGPPFGEEGQGQEVEGRHGTQ